MKLLLAVCLMFAAVKAQAFTLVDLRNQVIDQTKVTVLESGGPSMFYDFSDGTSGAFKVGATDHVLTNRFLQVDASWLGGTDGHVDGIGIFGPSIIVTEAISYFSPDSTAVIKSLLPGHLKDVWIGFGVGWGTDGWRTHYGFSFGKNF